MYSAKLDGKESPRRGEAIAVVYLDSKTAEFEAGRRQLAEWEKMYSQFMPEIKSALERRNIRELDVAIQRLPLMDESILSAQHTFTQWTYERKALLTDLQAVRRPSLQRV